MIDSVKDFLIDLTGAISLVLFIGVFLLVLNEGDNMVKRHEEAKENATKIEGYYIVEDKHTNVDLVGDLLDTVYYLDVYAEDNKAIKGSISVNSETYYEIEIGARVKCIAFHYDDGSVGIEIAK